MIVYFKFHTDDSKLLNATVKKLVATATWDLCTRALVIVIENFAAVAT